MSFCSRQKRGLSPVNGYDSNGGTAAFTLKR